MNKLDLIKALLGFGSPKVYLKFCFAGGARVEVPLTPKYRKAKAISIDIQPEHVNEPFSPPENRRLVSETITIKVEF